MPHNPASIVRLLYGERTSEKKTQAGIISLPSNSLTPGPPIGQGHPLRGLRPALLKPAATPIGGSFRASGWQQMYKSSLRLLSKIARQFSP
jgi:hypothetical protein